MNLCHAVLVMHRKLLISAAGTTRAAGCQQRQPTCLSVPAWPGPTHRILPIIAHRLTTSFICKKLKKKDTAQLTLINFSQGIWYLPIGLQQLLLSSYTSLFGCPFPLEEGPHGEAFLPHHHLPRLPRVLACR